MFDQRMENLGRLMDVAVMRGRIHAANLANQNTPGYRAKAVAFDEAFAEAVASGDDEAARAIQPEIYEPRTTKVKNDGNDVSSTHEVVEASKNRVLYNAYVAMIRGKMRIMDTAISSPGA